MSKDYLIYVLSHGVTGLLPTVTFFLLARSFSVADFGLLNLGTIALGWMTSLLLVGLPQSLTRDLPGHGQRGTEPTLVRTLWILMAVISGGGALLLIAGLALAPSQLIPGTLSRVLIAATACVFGLNMVQFGEQYLSANSRRGAFLGVRLLGRGTDLALVALLAGVGLMSPASRFAVQAVVSTLLAAFLGLTLHRRMWAGKFSGHAAKRALQYGTSTVGLAVAFSVTAGIDRYILNQMQGLDAVGRYAAAAALAAAPNALIIAPLSVAALPYLVREATNGRLKELQNHVSIFLDLYILVAVGSIAGMFLLGDPLLFLITGGGYEGLGNIIAMLTAGHFVYGVCSLTWLGLMLEDRFRPMYLGYGVAAAIIIAGNLILVPRWSLAGSAFAYMLGMAAYATITTIAASKRLPLRFPLRGSITTLAVGAAAAALGAFVSTKFGDWAGGVAGLGAYAIFLAIRAIPLIQALSGRRTSP